MAAAVAARRVAATVAAVEKTVVAWVAEMGRGGLAVGLTVAVWVAARVAASQRCRRKRAECWASREPAPAA